jgi:nicotinamide riboside kinase
MGHKIALSGAFSSGKTTLFKILIERFPQLRPYPEIASATKTLCPTLDWRRDDVRGYLRWAQIVAERQQEYAEGVGLFDGSFADLIAHERAFGSCLPAILPELTPKRYDLTLLSDPIGIPVEINGIRETDENLRLHIHALVFEEVGRLSLRVAELQGALDDRITLAVKEVGALLKRLDS